MLPWIRCPGHSGLCMSALLAGVRVSFALMSGFSVHLAFPQFCRLLRLLSWVKAARLPISCSQHPVIGPGTPLTLCWRHGLALGALFPVGRRAQRRTASRCNSVIQAKCYRLCVCVCACVIVCVRVLPQVSGQQATLLHMLLAAFHMLFARDIDGLREFTLANLLFTDMAEVWPRLAARVAASGNTNRRPGSPATHGAGCVVSLDNLMQHTGNKAALNVFCRERRAKLLEVMFALDNPGPLALSGHVCGSFGSLAVFVYVGSVSFCFV